VDQEHADEMRHLLNNLNADIVKNHPDYVCRVTSDEKAIGKGHLGRFQELETETPVILTTSQLLSTGVDAPMVKNVVLIRIIGTMTEFKQIIGRGTRLREDYGKFYFNILDYTGTATRHFADKEFDGDPESLSEEEIDDDGVTTTTTIAESGPDNTDGEDVYGDGDEDLTIDPRSPIIIDPPERPPERRKLYVEKGKVSISMHLTQDLDAEGKQLRATEFRNYTSEVVRSLFLDVAKFRNGWADPDRRAEILTELEAKGIGIAEAGEAFGNPDADPFDWLCNIAWNAPLLTRKERASRLRNNAPSFFDEYGLQARQILDTLLDKYAEHGPAEFTIPESLKVPPLSELGNVTEITQRFGGADQFRAAVAKLQELLYAA
jgi:type I restriction enzyme R subunit